MRQILLVILALCMSTLASALSVTKCEAGKLQQLVDDCSITQLEVSGYIDARDFRFIADSLRHLTVLDLGNAQIKSYKGETLFANINEYADNEVPSLALASMLQLTHCVLPSSATRLGNGSFAGCTQLKQVELGNSMSHIGDFAFSGCAQLESLFVPGSLCHIGEGAFSNCQSLVSIELMPVTPSNDVTTMSSPLHIGYRAFANCPSLSMVELGNLMNELGDETFAASGLETINMSSQSQLKTLPAWSLADTPVQQVVLPPNVQTIGDGALMGAENLSQLMLPATVNYIGSHAMAYMTGLTQLESKATEVPELGDSVWYGVEQSTVRLKVSPQSLAEYRAAAQWCNFMINALPRGDVNADGQVDIADVNIVINLMLGKDDPDNYDGRAYLTEGDTVVDIADVNAAINLMLGRIRALRLAAQQAAQAHP